MKYLSIKVKEFLSSLLVMVLIIYGFVLALQTFAPLIPFDIPFEWGWSFSGDFIVDSEENLYVFSEYGYFIKYDKNGNFIESVRHDTEATSHPLMSVDIKNNIYLLGDGIEQHLPDGKYFVKFTTKEIRDNNFRIFTLSENYDVEANKEQKVTDSFIQCEKRHRYPIKPGDIIFDLNKKEDSGCEYTAGIYDEFTDKNGNTYNYEKGSIVKRSSIGTLKVIYEEPVIWKVFGFPFPGIFIWGAIIFLLIILNSKSSSGCPVSK